MGSAEPGHEGALVTRGPFLLAIHRNGEISSLRIDFPEDVDGVQYEIIGIQVRKRPDLTT
jgi:hypothetical protein